MTRSRRSVHRPPAAKLTRPDRDRSRLRLSGGPRRMSAPRSCAPFCRRCGAVDGRAPRGRRIVATMLCSAFRASRTVPHPVRERADRRVRWRLLCLIGGVLQVHRGLAGVRRDPRARLVAGSTPAETRGWMGRLSAPRSSRWSTTSTRCSSIAPRRCAGPLARAGDLAHGLKTPLDGAGPRGRPRGPIGSAGCRGCMRQQVERMRRQIDYHLAHARAAASGAAAGGDRAWSNRRWRRSSAPCGAAPRRSRSCACASRSATPAVARVQREDLDEMLGNLLDNACKWAPARPCTSAAAAATAVVHVTVDDDGPGVARGVVA